MIELGRAERLVLLVATGIGYDLENASEERRGVREHWRTSARSWRLAASYGLFFDPTWVPELMTKYGLKSPFG